MELSIMTTAIKNTATSKQVPEPSRELNADELALVTGGTPSAVTKNSPEPYLMYTFQNTAMSGYSLSSSP
jgi:hypothetical protein